jgi:hypothetical protein
MYDGIDSDASRIPVTAQLVAGYVDGNYAWSAADWARFPHSVKVRIAVHPTTNDGHVLDCEPGNCGPEDAVNWVLLRRHAGMDPTVYCNQTNAQTGWPAIQAAFDTHDVPQPHYWVAKYDGETAIPAGAVAKQYQSSTYWDLSSVADYWPGVDPTPTPPASTPTSSKKDNDMQATSINGRAGLTWPAGSCHVIQCNYDSSLGQPHLKVTLPMAKGPQKVLETNWLPADGSGTLQIPADLIAGCRGAILQLVPGTTSIIFDATAV